MIRLVFRGAPNPARRALLAPALAAAALLAGCSQEPQFAPVCPQLALLAEGADLVRFAGTGRDMTDRVLEAKIVSVDGSCEPGKKGQVTAKIKVLGEMIRGPAAQGRTAQVPYFVAVTRGDQIVDRKQFVMSATFPANVELARVDGGELSMSFPVSARQGAQEYKIYVSLQLTEDELAYNRRMERRP
jgi:hypothetical protein